MLCLLSLMETPPLPVKGCKFWPKLCTYNHWAVRVLQRASPYNGHLRGSVTLTPIAKCFAVELSLPVLTTFAAGIRTHDLPLAGQTLLPIAPPLLWSITWQEMNKTKGSKIKKILVSHSLSELHFNSELVLINSIDFTQTFW